MEEEQLVPTARRKDWWEPRKAQASLLAQVGQASETAHAERSPQMQ
jgi:hypothetical protein